MTLALWIALGALTAAFVAPVFLRRWRARHLVWRTPSITAEIQRDDQYNRTGQFLNLDQKLEPGETGWTNMKINIPEHWIVKGVNVGPRRVYLNLVDGRSYALTRWNVGALSWAILNGGDDKPDDVLEKIWERHARASHGA